MRIQVNVGEEMVKKLDSISDQIGTTRSGLCAMLIGQGVMAYESSMKIVMEKLGSEELFNDILDEVKKENAK